MIIEFQPYLDRRRALASSADVAPSAIKNPFATPFDDAPEAYRASFKHLWPLVHAAISKRDLSPTDTERRLGVISNLVLYLVEGWPEKLTSFLWRKCGEGCLEERVLRELLPLIDRTAAAAKLKPIEQVKAEQENRDP